MRRRLKVTSSALKSPDEYKMEGAARSIRKTIGELIRILKGSQVKIEGRLRRRLYEVIEDLTVEWYERGWKRGIESARKRVFQMPRRVRTVVKVTAPHRTSSMKRVRRVNLRA